MGKKDHESDDQMEEEEEEYEVEKILDKKKERGVVFYSVKWVGWADPTWEEEENLTGCEEKLKEYEQNLSKQKDKDKDKDKKKKGTPAPAKSTPTSEKSNKGKREAPKEVDIPSDPSTLPPEKDAVQVMGATDSPTLAFLLRFKNGKCALVEKQACRDKYPKLLCDFLLERVQMSSPEPGST